MKRKLKNLFVFAVICCAANVAAAQEFYIKAGGGYNFAAGKSSSNGMLWNYTATEDGTVTLKDIPFSLGKSINTTLGIGCMFNQYIGVELSGNYLIGISTKSNIINEDSWSSEKSTIEIKSSSLILTPAIKLVLPLGDKFSAYSRLGISLPVMRKAIYSQKTKSYDEYDFTSTTSIDKRETEFTSYFAIGFNSSLGVNYAFTDRLSVFAEVNASLSSFQLKKSTVTKDEEDGEDMLSSLSTYEKETEYKKELEYNYYEETDWGKPRQATSFTLPSSSIGITVGVAFNF